MKSRCTQKGVLGLLVMMLVLATSAFATNYYVATDGDDEDPGTIGEPFATLEHALVDVAEAGDTIYIRGGSYHEECSATTVGGTSENPITITNYNGEEVTFDGSEALSDIGGSSWSVDSGNIYKTTITKDIWQLWVDDKMMVVARWPNVTVGHPCDPVPLKSDDVTPVDGSWWDKWGTWGHMDNAWNDDGELTNDTLYHDMGEDNVSYAGGSIILNFHSESQFCRPIESHTAGSNDLEYTPVQNPHDQGQGHFLIEANTALDKAGEWYYNESTGEVRLWCENGQTPQGRDVRGKTISYAIDIPYLSYVTIKGINFFGCTVNLPFGQNLTIEDCEFLYPSWYRRMLGEYGYQGEPEGASTQPPETGATFFNNNADLIIRDCVFKYSDAMIYMLTGQNNLVENCLFDHWSFTGMAQMLLMANGNPDGVVKNCTFSTNGSKVMVKHTSCDVQWCQFGFFGYLQQDGTAMQCAGGQGAGGGSDGTVRKYNWHHQSWKTGCRWDGDNGINGTDHHFVSWNNPSSMLIKGDYHTVVSNTSIELHDPGEPGIKMVDADSEDPKNRNSDCYNNLADAISKYTHEYSVLTCNNSNNWNGYVDSTGPGDMGKHRIRDISNWDFRPKTGSDAIDAGTVYSPITDGYLGSAPDIGAYEYGCTDYWIPGYQSDKARTPIPLDESPVAPTDCDLMWLEGKDTVSNNVYFGTASGSLTYQSNQSNNIYNPGTLSEDETYYWRIDTVTASDTITGDEWSFTAGTPVSTDFTDLDPIADTYVQKDNPTNNYGDNDVLSLKTGETTEEERDGYMKFNINISGTIVSAKLHLYATGASTSGGVQVYEMTDTSWSEMSMTWNNRATIDGLLLDEQDIYSLTYRAFDVSDAVTGNGTISFGLDRHPADSNRGISAREHATNPPYLQIEYTTEDLPPAAPTNLDATGGIMKVTLDWDDNTESDLDGYKVYRRQNPEDYFEPIHAGLVSTSDYTDTSMTPELEYQYMVKAVDEAAQYSYQSNIDTATASGPDSTPPANPTGLAATGGNGQVSLDWNNNTESDLDGYNVYRSTTSGSGFSKINESLVSPSDYTDTSVSNGTTYYYKVTAVDTSSNESGYSSEDSALPVGWEQLTYDDFESGWGNYTSGGVDAKLYTDGTYAHQGTACADIEDNTGVTASFYHTNGIDVDTAGYTQIKVEFWFKAISFDNSAEDFWVQYYDGTDWHTVETYVYDTDFQNDTFYDKTGANAVYINEGTGEGEYTFPDDMKIRFMCDASGGGDDAYIDEIKVSAIIGSEDTTPPANPTGLAATAGDEEVTLDWNDNTEGDLDGYNVYRSTTSGSGFSKINGSLVSASAYTDSTVTNNTTYYYVVTAVDTNENESGNSNEDSAYPADTTPPANPTGLAATAGDEEVTLDWNDNTEGDLDGYNVYRSTTTGSGYSKINGSLVSPSAYTDNTVSNDTTYYYVVRAVDTSSNESGNSNEDSAMPEAPQDTTPPANPTGLDATAGYEQVTLDWNDNTEGDLDGYNVYRSTTTGSGYSKINGALVSESAYTDSTVANNTTYYYVVTAVDTSSNESGYSNEDSATPSSGGNLQFNPTDDSFVKSAQASTNYGDNDTLQVRTGNRTIYSYLKFSVSGVTGTVTTALLKIRSVTSMDDTSVKVVSDTSWSEDTVVWNNKPAMGSTLDTQSSVAATTWYSLDVTSHITGNGTFSLGLSTTQDASDRTWSSKESNYDPVLDVTW